jgi:hypothetical protein
VQRREQPRLRLAPVLQLVTLLGPRAERLLHQVRRPVRRLRQRHPEAKQRLVMLIDQLFEFTHRHPYEPKLPPLFHKTSTFPSACCRSAGHGATKAPWREHSARRQVPQTRTSAPQRRSRPGIALTTAPPEWATPRPPPPRLSRVNPRRFSGLYYSLGSLITHRYPFSRIRMHRQVR